METCSLRSHLTQVTKRIMNCVRRDRNSTFALGGGSDDATPTGGSSAFSFAVANLTFAGVLAFKNSSDGIPNAARAALVTALTALANARAIAS